MLLIGSSSISFEISVAGFVRLRRIGAIIGSSEEVIGLNKEGQVNRGCAGGRLIDCFEHIKDGPNRYRSIN